MAVVPYKDKQAGKKEQVATMFDNISPRYDLLNRLLSAGIDVRWRKKAIRLLKKEQPESILDIATGTGDFAIAALETGAKRIVGIDISEGMLKIGKEKIKKQGLEQRIQLELGDSESLRFEASAFDAIIVAFGVRNFEDLERGLKEIFRVLKNNGTVVILEFSKPGKFPVKNFYTIYFRYILPFIGRMISKDKAAYTYLPESVNAFPDGKDFLKILEKTGFKTLQCIPLTFGISSIYIGKK